MHPPAFNWGGLAIGSVGRSGGFGCTLVLLQTLHLQRQSAYAFDVAVSRFAWTRFHFVTIVGAVTGLSCESAQGKACLAGYAAAQTEVLEVDAKSSDSVGTSLQTVETALQACRAAGRHEEVEQLIKARNELSAQLGLLDRRAKRRLRKEPSPAEVAELEKRGDPNCPKGQAYRHKDSKEIRCTGRQLVELGFNKAKDYFEEQGYRVRSPSPTTLEAEHGAERYQFIYSSPASSDPATCVVLVPAPGVPWEEALARAAGANPRRLKDRTVRIGSDQVPYTVDDKNVILRIGNCPKPEPG